MNNLPGLVSDVLPLGAWLVILSAIFVPLERLFSLHASKAWRRETGVDLAYYFINSLLPAALLALPLALVASLAQRMMPADFLAAMRGLPLWIGIPLALVVGDMGSYWGHRLSHEIPWLWRFHAVHHSAEHIDFMVNTRAHPVDMVVTRMFGLVPLTLLGLGSGEGKSDLLPLVAAVIGTFASFFVHANVRWRFGPLEWLVATPAFHHWHHSRNDHIDRNYAATFPMVDMLFGTYYLPRHWPPAYGTDTVVAPSLGGQLWAPLAASFNQLFGKRDASP